MNTRITYKSVFVHYQARLAKVGVNDDNEFRSIIRAEERHRNRDLHSKQDDARQKSAAQSNTWRGKNGIMSDMKGHAKSALALTLAIAGGIAAGMRCDASAQLAYRRAMRNLRLRSSGLHDPGSTR